MSLLLLAAEWGRGNCVPVSCVTVDHKLREESAEEAAFVGDFCKSIGINHKILEWKRDGDSVAYGKLENLAREARYRLIAEFCRDNSIPIVLVGHTWNDQLETFEMRKNRGSSSAGLAGMSQVRSLADNVKLFRPILHFTKGYLENLLRSRNISWKVDPMNHHEIFLRVSCRKKISAYDSDKISAVSNEIVQFGKRRNEIETSAVYFLKNFCGFSELGYAVLEKERLLSEEKEVQAEVLKRLIWNVGGKKYAVNITEDILEKIFSKKINTLGRCLLKIRKNEIFVLREDRNKKTSEGTLFPLPYVCRNHKITSEPDELLNGFLCLEKINLFDIFL
jgi:tRNA(Ile)-lysidine synthase